MSKRITKSLIANGSVLVSETAWNAELEAKHEKLVEFLNANKLAGVLIRRNENVAWLTGGAVELRVLTPCETGVAALLVTAAGKRYYFTTENEAPRLHDEEFGALDFEPVLFPWWADDTNASAAKLAGGPLGYSRRGPDACEPRSAAPGAERDRNYTLPLAGRRDRGCHRGGAQQGRARNERVRS